MILGRIEDVFNTSFPNYLTIEEGDIIGIFKKTEDLGIFEIKTIENNIAKCSKIESDTMFSSSIIKVDLKKDFYYVRLLILDSFKNEEKKYRKINFRPITFKETLKIKRGITVLCDFTGDKNYYNVKIPELEDKLKYLTNSTNDKS